MNVCTYVYTCVFVQYVHMYLYTIIYICMYLSLHLILIQVLLNVLFTVHAGIRGVTEQTTSGLYALQVMLKKRDLKVPSIVINNSVTKVTHKHIRTCYSVTQSVSEFFRDFFHLQCLSTTCNIVIVLYFHTYSLRLLFCSPVVVLPLAF